jgi:hypothetical protein
MLKRAMRIYIIPAKPAQKPPDPKERDPALELIHLKRYADALCRDIFSKLAILDPSRIRKIPLPKDGVRS